MKKFLIAAGVASLLIAAQAVASDVAGVSEGAPRVTDRLGSSVPSYNVSLSLSTTQETGDCVMATRKNLGFQGTEESTARGLTPEQCEQRRIEEQSRLDQWQQGVFTVGVGFTAVAATVIVLDDEAQTD